MSVKYFAIRGRAGLYLSQIFLVHSTHRYSLSSVKNNEYYCNYWVTCTSRETLFCVFKTVLYCPWWPNSTQQKETQWLNQDGPTIEFFTFCSILFLKSTILYYTVLFFGLKNTLQNICLFWGRLERIKVISIHNNGERWFTNVLIDNKLSTEM